MRRPQHLDCVLVEDRPDGFGRASSRPSRPSRPRLPVRLRSGPSPSGWARGRRRARPGRAGRAAPEAGARGPRRRVPRSIAPASGNRRAGSGWPSAREYVAERSEVVGHSQRDGATRDDGRDRRVADVGDMTGDRLHEDDGQGVAVGPPVDRRAAGLLGCGVARGADDAAVGLGPARFGERAGETEVGDPHDPVLVEEEVRRLHVAVDHPAGVGVVERLRDLPAHVRGLGRAQATAGVEQRPQAAALEQLQHEERHPLVLAPVVHRDDVGVVQRRRVLGLAAEPPEEPGVLGETAVEHLDGHAAAQPHVVGHVHPARRARADRAEEAVTTGEDAPGQVGDGRAGHPQNGTGHTRRGRGRGPRGRRYPRR